MNKLIKFSLSNKVNLHMGFYSSTILHIAHFSSSMFSIIGAEMIFLNVLSVFKQKSNIFNKRTKNNGISSNQ